MAKHLIAFLIAAMLAITTSYASTVSTENEIIDTREMVGYYKVTVERTPDGTKFARFDGDVGYLFGYSLSNLLQIHPDVEYLEMHSTGGNLDEIYAPAKVIREMGLPVVVRKGEYCVSACAYLAMASPDIRIGGQLAFHLPYFEAFSMNDTLYTVSQTAVVSTINMNRYLFDNGWKLIFYFMVQFTTDHEKFVVFESEEELDKFRYDDPTTFSENVPLDILFEVRTGPQISAFAQEQRKEANGQ